MSAAAWERVLSVRRMVWHQLGRYKRRWRRDHLEDMAQNCYVALHSAATRYDPKKAKWSTFAYYTISYTISTYMTNERKVLEGIPKRIESWAEREFGYDEESLTTDRKWVAPAKRCIGCQRSLVPQKRGGKLDHRYEARSYRLDPPTCDTCAKRESRRRARGAAK